MGMDFVWDEYIALLWKPSNGSGGSPDRVGGSLGAGKTCSSKPLASKRTVCSASSKLEARWNNMCQQWQKKFPWLYEEKIDGRFVLRCRYCPDYAVEKLENAQPGSFRAHDAAFKHKARLPGATQTAETSPSEADFQKVLDQFRSGVTDDGKLGRWKRRKIKFCLAEACRQRARGKLRDSVCMTLFADGWRCMLGMRAKCCGYDLQPSSMSLGIIDYKAKFNS